MKKRLIVFLLLLPCLHHIYSRDVVFNTLKSELDRNFSILKKESVPAYYISLRLDEHQYMSCSGRMGRLQSVMQDNSPSHMLSSMVRVGSPELDNTHEIRDNYGSYNNVRLDIQNVPVDNNPTVIKRAIWTQLDNLYKENVQSYEQVKANIAVKVEQEDKSPDFSEEKADKYYEDRIDFFGLSPNKKEWEEKVKMYSSVFNQNNEVLDGYAFFYISLARKYFVDTEGRKIVQNELMYNLVLAAEALADDGMSLPLNKSWIAHSLDELPSDKEVIQAAQEMSGLLSALKKAPVVESFTGPAILSPEASGVFFHEIFGHRVEGSRLKQETDAQTFKKKIGEEVLPKHISVTFDPTVSKYNNISLNGSYTYDDEGIKAQRVEVVKKGVLNNFLMSRTPIEGFARSNGHGRAQAGLFPISRQSNMFVESTQKYSEEDLRKMLIKEAKAQGKPYAYFFKEVSGGFTQTGRYMPNSFNVTPLIVYRIYTDGRPDELVRGVDLVGTPLAMFSKIEACGKQYSVFNGTCGAESGGIPVSCIAPALFVKQIETQKKPKSQLVKQILPKPEGTTGGSTNRDEIIFNAIKKEVDRGLEGLKMDDLKSPFFISYTISDAGNLSMSSTLGSLTGSNYFPHRVASSRLLMGDYNCTDENFVSSVGGPSGHDGNICLEDDEEGIRYTIWRDLDAIYKSAAETYEQKMSAIKQLNIPESQPELPDWDKTPVVQLLDLPQPKVNFEKSNYEQYINEASAIFADYKDILYSNVTLQVYSGTIYFYNTEKTQYRLPLTFATLDVSATARTETGEMVGVSTDYTVSHPDEFPSGELLKKRCRELAEKLLKKKTAAKMKEAYAGPVLFEGLAVVETFYRNFFFGDISLIAERKPLTAQGYSYGGNTLEEMIGKRITAKEITIEDLTGSKEYKGHKLIGYTPIDAQGVVPPEKLVLVENGMLKTLLSDRIPTAKVPHSNGHSLHSPGAGASINTGAIRLQHTGMKSKEALRQELLSKAKEEGYEYAYIVRETMGAGSLPLDLYRVNVEDGSEELVRSAQINNVNSQIFKKISAVSDKELIYNGNVGNLITIIVPDAILFEEMEIQKDMLDNYQKPPIVPQPEN